MARPSLYHLPVKQAIAKTEEHMHAVLGKLAEQHPKKPLHQVPWRDVLQTTARTIAMREDFLPDEYDAFHPHESGKWLYANYELGNALMLERVVSRLRTERLLRESEKELFKTALGKLYDNPPLEYKGLQLKAFKELLRNAGRIRAVKLFTRAGELWNQNGKEIVAATRSGPDQLDDYDLLTLGDMFGNPRVHQVFHHVTFAETQSKVGVLAAYKLALTEQASPLHGALVTRRGKRKVVLPYKPKYNWK